MRQKLAKDCYPIVNNSDLGNFVNLNTIDLDVDGIAYPCGLLPMLFPADVFLGVENTQTLQYKPISRKNIANQGTSMAFKKHASVGQGNWTDVGSPLFVNWMKYSSATSPIKLWGRIDETIPKGSYAIHVNNSFDVSYFNGGKTIVVVQNSPFITTSNYMLIGVLIADAVIIYLFGILSIKLALSKEKPLETKS